MSNMNRAMFAASRSGGAVADDLNFDAASFMGMPPEERVRTCLKLAGRAQALAATAPEPHKNYYLIIAQNWLSLAEEMGRDIPPKD